MREEYVYTGRRTKDGCKVTVEHAGVKIDLPPRLDLWNHSPDGFEWGYGGSGPAQLALAILCCHTRDRERSCELHQLFKWDVVSKLPKHGWTMTGEDIQIWLDEQEETGDRANG